MPLILIITGIIIVAGLYLLVRKYLKLKIEELKNKK